VLNWSVEVFGVEVRVQVEHKHSVCFEKLLHLGFCRAGSLAWVACVELNLDVLEIFRLVFAVEDEVR